MILTGVPMGAQEAMQRGLVSKVFPVDQESDYCSSFWEMILICKTVFEHYFEVEIGKVIHKMLTC